MFTERPFIIERTIFFCTLKRQCPNMVTVFSHWIEKGACDTSIVMRNQEAGGKFLKKRKGRLCSDFTQCIYEGTDL